MTKTSIEWTEHTWNPIVGCSIVSPGCTNCYAMKMAARIEAMGNQPRYAGTTRKVNGNAVWTGKIAQAPDSVLLAPLRRKKPTTYFVNSMGDLFHEDCPDEWIDPVFAVMALTPQHTYQVLTKRPARMRAYFSHAGRLNSINGQKWSLLGAPRGSKIRHGGGEWMSPCLPLPNVWLGVSAERQQEWDERTDHLRNTLAAIRFVSAEPLLGQIYATKALHEPDCDIIEHGIAGTCTCDKPRLDWVIVGGESGHGARSMHPDWARSLRDQCTAAGVAFFFKQWGEWMPCPHDSDEAESNPRSGFCHPGGETAKWPTPEGYGEYGAGWLIEHGFAHVAAVGKKRAGRLLDGVTHNAMPQVIR